MTTGRINQVTTVPPFRNREGAPATTSTDVTARSTSVAVGLVRGPIRLLELARDPPRGAVKRAPWGMTLGHDTRRA